MPNKSQNKKSQNKLADIEPIEQCQLKPKETKLAEKPPNTVTIVCSHGGRHRIKAGSKLIELVPDISKTIRAIDKLKIKITGPHDPPVLYVSPEIGKISGGGTFEIPTFIDDLPIVLPGGVLPIFDALKHISFYLLNKSKSFTVSGFPDGISNKQVIVYNPVEWEFKLILPPLYSHINKGKFEYGYKYGGGGIYSGSQVEKSTKNRGNDYKFSTVEEKKRDGSIVKHTITESLSNNKEKISEKVSLVKDTEKRSEKLDYELNKSEGEEHQWFTIKNNNGKFYNVQINEIINLGKNLMYVIEVLKNTVLSVKFGAYFDYQLKNCFEGELTAKFGYKEHSNHEAYFNYICEGQLLLVSATFEAGVGISAGVFFNAQLFAYGDFEVSIPVELSSKPPDEHRTSKSPIEAKASVSLTFKVGLGGRANASFFYEYEVKGTTGLKAYIELSFFGNPPFDLKAAFNFLGVYYTLKQSIGKSGVFGEKQKADIEERGLKEDKDIVVKTGLNESMTTDLKDPEKDKKTLIGEKELGSFSLSGNSFSPDFDLEDNKMLDQLKDALAETEGYFDYSSRLIVVRPKEKESEGYFERTGQHMKGWGEFIFTNNAIDYTKYDVVSDKELAQIIMNKISEFGDLDRSSKGFEGLLTAIKNHLRKLMGGDPVLTETIFKNFVSKDLPNILFMHRKIIKI